MNGKYCKVIASFILMIMLITVIVPTSAVTAEEAQEGGLPEILKRDKIRILEVYPNEKENESEDISQMDVRKKLGSDPGYEITTISINRLISLQEEINGNYDVVYFNNGSYRRNATTEHSYGSDITNLTADKLEEFIRSGQLCIFHEGVFQKGSSYPYNTILKARFAGYVNNPSYKNFITVTDNAGNSNYKNTVINNIGTLYKDTSKGMNQRPVLEITECPATYSSSNTGYVSNNLMFSFKVYDPETPLDQSLLVDLYIDRNNDSLYNEDREIIYPQTDEATGQKYTVRVKNGQSGTITYNMPQGLSGVYFWKLVARDDKNAKNEAGSVFRLKGGEIRVKVLQIKPDNGGNLSLINQFNKSAGGHKYGEKPGEYKIEVTETTVAEFNRAADLGTLQLNGVYDMIVLGFYDNYTNAEYMTESGWNKYKGALGAKAVAAIREFVDTKQSVMFTHDTIHFQKNRELTREFGRDVGQVFVNNGYSFDGIWTAGLAGSSLEGWNAGNAKERINMFDPQRPEDRKNNEDMNNTRHYQVINTWPDTGNFVNPVNTTALTLYPFIIEGGKYDDYEERRVASTHYQWYKLDLEDPEVIPLFNLYADGKGKFNDDAMNNYYTYTKGNLTYSGTGHKTNSSEQYPDFETRLFVNTAIRAYSIANHAPEITVLEPQDNEKIPSTAENLTLKFRADDFDLGDDELQYRIFVDRNNTNNFTEATALKPMDNGEVITEIIDRTHMPVIGKFKLKVIAKDKQGAEAERVINLERVDQPVITPSIEICDAGGNPVNGVLVNEEVTAKMTFAVTGKANPSVQITPKFDLTGKYRNESEITILNDSSLGQVVFHPVAEPAPSLIEKQHTNIKVSPALSGETSLEMTAKVESIDRFLESKTATDSVNVRSGQVKIYVVDQDGTPIRNVTIRDLGGAGTWTTNNSGFVGIEGVVGKKDFDIIAPAGYVRESETIYRLNAAGVRVSEEDEVDLTYEDFSWEIEYRVRLNLGVSVDYYRINQTRTSAAYVGPAVPVIPAGTESYNVRNHKNTAASILAKIIVDPLASGKVTKMKFTLETWDGTNQITSGPLMATIDSTADNEDTEVIEGTVGDAVKSLIGINDTTVRVAAPEITVPDTDSLAGRELYLIIDVPRTNGQTIKLKDVVLTVKIDTPSGGVAEKPPITVSLDSKGIKFIETNPPPLR